MKVQADIPYPDNEKSKLALLATLFQEWHLHFVNTASTLTKHVADDMVCDGFYPYYFSQRKKILFIGREARGISGCNYLDILFDAYRHTKRIGRQHLNRSRFHYRMLRIAYGIMNGAVKWKDTPRASQIGDTFGTADGLSFAFMNISNLSNDSDTWQVDRPVWNAAHLLSTQRRNFIQEEIAILEPDIIITMNLGRNKLDSLGSRTPINYSTQATSYWLDTGTRRSLLIDTWHFSTWTKNDIADYYTPICDAIRGSEGSDNCRGR